MGKRVVHVEFPSQDVDRAQKFWEGAGGWSIQTSGETGPPRTSTSSTPPPIPHPSS